MKTQRSPTADTRLNLAFHALADPTRRAIVDRLLSEPASVSALAEPLRLSLPALGYHLRALERGGLVRSTKSGRVRTVSIDPAAIDDVERWISTRRQRLEQRVDRLEAFLAARTTRGGRQ